LCSFFVYVTTGTTSGAGTAYPSGSPWVHTGKSYKVTPFLI
jgi:hypothetical protein